MNRLRACISYNTTLATLVLAGLLLCTVHLDAQASTIAADHHTAPHTAQCIDTCIDHVPAVPSIHARTASTVAPELFLATRTEQVTVATHAGESLQHVRATFYTSTLTKLYIHYSILRV